jgi:hypothetical protein
MKLFEISTPAGPRYAVLIGEGLIGTAIRASLIKQIKPIASAQISTYSSSRIAEVAAQLLRLVPAEGNLDWLWSAGKTGFTADEQTIGEETRFFDLITDFIAENWAHRTRHFHFLSSAGGIFEGSSRVSSDTPPTPARPYGLGKLREEGRVRALFDNFSIYRPTTVFGPIRQGQRAGLISTIIQNAFLHRVTAVTGSYNTLRDYVFSADIGDYIADRVARTQLTSGEFLLATGKPSAVGEIIHYVESSIHRPVYVRYAAGDNVTDITVNPCALPADWGTADIRLRIREVVRDHGQRFHV